MCSPEATGIEVPFRSWAKLSIFSAWVASSIQRGRNRSTCLAHSSVYVRQLGANNGASPRLLSTAKLVATLNRQLYANTSLEKYATFYFALYHEATHSLTYTNAGHLSPMLLRSGELQMLESTGTVVGER